MDNLTINQAIQASASRFIARCDHAYRVQVFDTARAISRRIGRCPVILLSGPSGSSKTTTAENLAGFLTSFGVRCHVIGLDDYYRDRNAPDYPRDEAGALDLESPLGLDIALLNEQMQALSRGEEITVPCFDFAAQRRDESRARSFRLQAGEAVIFEGINALNPIFTRPNPNATRVFVCPQTPITCRGRVIFNNEKIRLLRRIVRDMNHRGQPPLATLQMWDSVRRGERLYIQPYTDAADLRIDTTLGYEVPVLGYLAKPLLEQLPPDAPQAELVRSILEALPAVQPISPELVSPDSLLRREFLGR